MRIRYDGRNDNQCKKCMNKMRYKAAKRNKKLCMTILRNMLGNKCKRCGYNKNIAALHFHHIKSKSFPLNEAIRSMKIMINEVKKCILLCANCHSTEHYKKDTKVYMTLYYRKRKQKLIEMFGGCCNKCGYDKCQAALVFHHIKNKSFTLGNINGLFRKWSEVIKEAKKCELLCANCHTELHQPQCSM